MPGLSFKWNGTIVAMVFLTAILLSAPAANAQQKAQNKTFVVIGTSTVHGDNIQVARHEAIAESLVTAVALMTKEILQVEALVENFPQVNEVVYENTDAFVQDYKVLTETRSGKSYRVIVEATVSGKKIAKQLSRAGILRTKVTLPAVLFLISEQSLQDDAPRYWWGKKMRGFESSTEATLANILRARGFRIIDHEGIEIGKVADRDLADNPELTDKEALDLARRMQADVVIVGAAIASPTASVMGDDLKSFKGNLNVRALNTETGEKMASVSRTAVTANVDEIAGGREALMMAGTLAGDQLAPQLAATWRKLAEKPSQVEMIVEGTGNLANFVKFRRALTRISGVGGIRVKEIKPNETTLIVEYEGKAEQLAAELMRQNFDNFGINIYEITAENLKIAIVSS